MKIEVGDIVTLASDSKIYNYFRSVENATSLITTKYLSEFRGKEIEVIDKIVTPLYGVLFELKDCRIRLPQECLKKKYNIKHELVHGKNVAFHITSDRILRLLTFINKKLIMVDYDTFKTSTAIVPDNGEVKLIPISKAIEDSLEIIKPSIEDLGDVTSLSAGDFYRIGDRVVVGGYKTICKTDEYWGCTHHSEIDCTFSGKRGIVTDVHLGTVTISFGKESRVFFYNQIKKVPKLGLAIGSEDYGVVGEETDLKGNEGNPLHVGDIVRLDGREELVICRFGEYRLFGESRRDSLRFKYGRVINGWENLEYGDEACNVDVVHIEEQG